MGDNTPMGCVGAGGGGGVFKRGLRVDDFDVRAGDMTQRAQRQIVARTVATRPTPSVGKIGALLLYCTVKTVPRRQHPKP